MPLGFFQRRYWICRLPWIVWTFLKYWFFQFMSTRVKKKNGAHKPLTPQNLQLVPKLCQDCCLPFRSRLHGQQASLSHTRSGWFSNCCFALHCSGLIHIPAFEEEISQVTAACGGGGHMNHTGFLSYMLWRFSFSLKSWGAWWEVPSFHSWRNSGFWVPSRLWVTALVNGEMCLSHA